MDWSPGFAMLSACSLTPSIPIIFLSLIYAVICLLPEEKRGNAFANKKLSSSLIIIVIVIFVLTFALLLHWSKGTYAM
jgi:hypothetical protein